MKPFLKDVIWVIPIFIIFALLTYFGIQGISGNESEEAGIYLIVFIVLLILVSPLLLLVMSISGRKQQKSSFNQAVSDKSAPDHTVRNTLIIVSLLVTAWIGIWVISAM